MTPSQSTRSTIDIVTSFKPTLTHSKSEQKEEDLNTWSGFSALSKHLLFLSLQIVQQMHKGADFQAFFFSSPQSSLANLRGAPLTESAITHSTLLREREKGEKP